MCHNRLHAAFARVAWLVVCLNGPLVRGQNAEPIHLDRWAGPARLVANPGPGFEDFRIVAEAVWDRATPRAVGRYAMQVSLPDGRVVVTPLTPREATGASRLDVLVPVGSVRNLRPEQVQVRAAVRDNTTGALVSNSLVAGIDDFPTPDPGGPAPDPGPFGWGAPLSPSVRRPSHDQAPMV